MTFSYNEQELEYVEFMRKRSIHGTPPQVRERLEEMSVQYGVDEFVVLTITYDFDARVRSYQLLAEEFGLS